MDYDQSILSIETQETIHVNSDMYCSANMCCMYVCTRYKRLQSTVMYVITKLRKVQPPA